MRETDGEIVVRVDAEIADMVPRFLANRATDLQLLREALARCDAQALQSKGHTLLGVGGGYGFAQISALGERIESAAIEGRQGDIARAVEELADFLARVRVEVEKPA